MFPIKKENPLTEAEKKKLYQLDKITVKRSGKMFTVTRERQFAGESYSSESLEKCFDYVRAAYDENGEVK